MRMTLVDSEKVCLVPGTLDEWLRGITEDSTGALQSAGHQLVASFPTVHVRSLTTGLLEAYSSTRADFRLSLDEFTQDFFFFAKGH